MKSANFFSNNNKKKGSKLKKLLIIFFIAGSLFLTNIPVANALFPVTDIPKWLWDQAVELIKKGGSIAFQSTLSNTLNKMAYDTANYIGSGASGQKPLFVTESFSDYAKNIADEAAGDFLETIINTKLNPDTVDCATKKEDCLAVCEDKENKTIKTEEDREFCKDQCESGAASCEKGLKNPANKGMNEFNICQPSSVEAKLQISLGLVEQKRPQAPNCTASKMINNWGDDISSKISLYESGDYLSNVKKYFDPSSNDVGILLSVNSDLQKTAEDKEKTTFEETKSKGGWLDVRNIAGKIEGTPDSARKAEEDARNLRIQNFGKTTGDILVDAANVFLNQLALSAFNNTMKNLAGLGGSSSSSSNNFDSLLTNPEADPGINKGSYSVKEKTMKILEVNSSTDREMNILAELSSCLKPENPSPNKCVIDERFMQAIIERKTVAEAIESGEISSSWKIEKEVFPSAYKNHFSLRNIKILRKHRILPIGWEVAIERAFSDPAIDRNATLQDLISCFDPNDSYNTYSDGFDVTDTLWCEGLVDPNWVLKAPLSYCGQKGSGAYIYETVYSQENKQYNIPEELMIFRSEDYCADNQSCIKENKEGGCDAFGYCVEERRTWKFKDKSCEPIDNTCQTFINSDSGEQVSYLENTIDYGDCNIDSAGCRRYSLSGDYRNNASIDWNFSNNLYFNKNMASCNPTNDGCTELIRVKPTWGDNLVTGSSYENAVLDEVVNTGGEISSFEVVSNSQDSEAVIIDEDPSRPGVVTKRVASVSGSGNAGLKSGRNTFPKNLQILEKQNYTLSADVYLISGDRLEAQLNPGDRQSVKVVNDSGKWLNISITSNSVEGLSSPRFSFIAYAGSNSEASFYIKNIKFELGDWATSYRPYASKKINQKLIPGYLEETCYVDPVSSAKDYSLKDNAPAICSNYSKKCNYNEAGCNLFTKVDDNFSAAAKTYSSDYCPGECLGYDVYISKENYFNSAEAENLIPSQGDKCSLEAVGCNEFTNLDKVEKGAEGREYYSRLKQCIKPDTAKCLEFYTWEASDSGVEITSYSLEKDSNGNPLTTFKNQADGDCSDIYDLPVGHPDYNSDCREYRNSLGQVSYRLSSHLITCSDNCFNYRLSEKNIDSSINSPSQCTGPDKHWNSSSSVCYSCLNGGVWSNDQGACIYKAIPNEGKTCRARDVSCREYNGSQGNNIRTLASFSFDSSLDSWNSSNSSGVSLAPVSSNQNGKSLKYTAGGGNVAQVKIGSKIRKNSSYTVKFLAKSTQVNNLSIYFSNEDGSETYSFNAMDESSFSDALKVNGGNEWGVYTVNISDLPENIGYNGMLNISAISDFYLDNLILTEVNNRHYLLKNSLEIPDACYYDNLGNYQGADYNLGCYQYRDQNDLVHNLHNFSDICSDSSVGCEQMIDTNNYDSPYSDIWQDENENGECDSDEESCVKVEGDTAIYAIYNQNMSCLEEDKGCTRMGEGLGYGSEVSWSDVYKLNNPNNYSRTLCLEDDLGCEEYKDSRGSLNYFRNPANNVCVYRSSKDPDIKGKFWFKAPVKRCDLNRDGKINEEEGTEATCSSDDDCTLSKCIVDTNDYYCPVSYLKTIGYGGVNSSIAVPDGAVGLCEEAESGCTEYVDPVSYFNPNLVKNSTFSKNGEFWGEDVWLGSRVSRNQQVVNFTRNKLYAFKKIDAESKTLRKNEGTASITFVNPVRVLREDNTYSSPLKTINLNEEPLDSYVIFNSLENYSALVSGGESANQVELKELAISYNLNTEDNSECSGIVNFDQGCVLFNERSVNGKSGIKNNSFNAYSTANSKNPVTSFGPYTANKLMKVTPDRNCATWLSCTSYLIDNDQKLCTSMAECNLLDDKNECANYVSRPPQESYDFDPEKNKNASGYAIPNTYYFNEIKEVGYNTRARYNFEETIPTLSCFKSNSNGTPIFKTNCVFDKNIAKDNLIKGPSDSLVSYPAEGRAFVKVEPSQSISPQAAGSYIVLPEKGEYYINYLVNTKNSNTNAVVSIVDVSSENNPRVLRTFKSSAPLNWERKVEKFTIDRESKIRIYLGSENTSITSAVYFDDVNIEAVLQTGENSYATRDCRLYPTSSSLACKDVDNSIVRNGIEGYCLEYDLANPNVCQLWMPLERISSARISSNKLGYDGKYPLNYCAEVNTDFMFLEKRVATLVKEQRVKGHHDMKSAYCLYPEGNLGFCGKVFSEFEIYVYEDEDGVKISTSSSQSETTVISSTTSVTTGTVTSVEENYATTTASTKDEPYQDISNYCGDSKNYFLLVHNETETERKHKYDYYTRRHICVPINGSGENKRYVPADFEENSLTDLFDRVKVSANGWYLANGFYSNQSTINELTNDADPLRVLDLNYPVPSSEKDLKKVSSSNPDEVFRLTCNKFVEAVSANGDNMAFAERVNKGSDYKISSVGGTTYYGYERKLGDIPFGAASWPSDFDLTKSDRVVLANQYSRKENEEIFAGRPYGCDASSDKKNSNCRRIGYCSANPNVYCLTGLSNDGFSGYDLSKNSCGSWGTCKPLWSWGAFSYPTNYSGPLGQLFLQAPTAYKFDQNNGGYTSTSGYYRSDSGSQSSKPSVSGLSLHSSAKEMERGESLKPGTYRLDFYAKIDPNKQPLREIFIDWGDGNQQVVSGYDVRSEGSGFPHSFYHYYSSSINSPRIRVKVYDNWGNPSPEATLR